MKELYVIESVISPGSFWSETHQDFKGWLFATKYTVYEGGRSAEETKKACLMNPCKITKVYDRQ